MGLPADVTLLFILDKNFGTPTQTISKYILEYIFVLFTVYN